MRAAVLRRGRAETEVIVDSAMGHEDCTEIVKFGLDSERRMRAAPASARVR